MFDHDGTMFFGGGLMWIFWIVLVVILFVAIKAIAGPDSGNKSTQSETPIEILKKRYAKGGSMTKSLGVDARNWNHDSCRKNSI